MNNFNIVWLIILFILVDIAFFYEIYIATVCMINDIKRKKSSAYLILDIIYITAFLNVIYASFKLIQYCVCFLLE